MNFSSYDLSVIKKEPALIYDMGGGVIREIADYFQHGLGPEPTERIISGLIGKVAPAKTLQDNISHARSVLGKNAERIAAEWLERSGVMNALSGAFWSPTASAVPPDMQFDAVVWSGGVANWQLRRRNLTERVDPKKVKRVILPMGNERLMAVSDHQLVATLADLRDHPPTEALFCEEYVLPALKRANFNVEVLPVPSAKGDTICEFVFWFYPELLKGTILTIGNAPNTIQGAGQLRDAARRVDDSFDENGDQLFMMGDVFPVAHGDEDKSTHQNPLSGIGQLTRNALFLYRAIAG